MNNWPSINSPSSEVDFISEQDQFWFTFSDQLSFRIREMLGISELKIATDNSLNGEFLTQVQDSTASFAYEWWKDTSARFSSESKEYLEKRVEHLKECKNLFDISRSDSWNEPALQGLAFNEHWMLSGHRLLQHAGILISLMEEQIDRTEGGRPLVAGTPLYQHINRLNEIWFEAGNTRIGSSKSVEGVPNGSLCALVRLTFDKARSAVNRMLEKPRYMPSFSDSSLKSLVTDVINGNTKVPKTR